MTKTKRYKASIAFTRVPDPKLVSHLHAIHDGLDGNPNFPTPPVDLAVFKTATDGFAASVALALDGGKKAIAEKNKQREGVIDMALQLAHHVQANYKGDLATFTSSGFEPVSYTRNPAQPLSQPAITNVEQGNTGQLLVTLKALPKARSYELRYAPLGAGGVPGTSTIATLTSAKTAPVDNLIPGTIYSFQVRALGKLGHTDWSDSVNRMCI